MRQQRVQQIKEWRASHPDSTRQPVFSTANVTWLSQVVIASKFGLSVDSPVCGKPEYVRECCEASLKRLQVDCIDLYYQHRHASSSSETGDLSIELLVCGKPEYVRDCCEASLKRLQVDCIELHYQHRHAYNSSGKTQ